MWFKNLEAEIKHAYFKDEEDAEEMLRMRRKRLGLVDDSIYAMKRIQILMNR